MNPLVDLSLHEVLAQLTPQELTFFSMLDAQLDKVETFYLARENEMVAQNFLLLSQLEELKDHREVFLVCRFLHPSLNH
jgi:SPX domain